MNLIEKLDIQKWLGMYLKSSKADSKIPFFLFEWIYGHILSNSSSFFTAFISEDKMEAFRSKAKDFENYSTDNRR